MVKIEHRDIFSQESAAWNRWRAENPGIQPYLVGAYFSRADLSGVNLSGADLCGANFKEANLRGADLSKAELHGVNFHKANLHGADLTEANLPDAILAQADLTEASLTKADLHGAYLGKADLRRADLAEANLCHACLYGTNASEANLSLADLSQVNFTKANLSGANLLWVDLSQAGFSETDFSGAFVGWTKFGNIDLRAVKGVDTVIHYGPSTIGRDTIDRSGGRIPESFLRGTGVPDNFFTDIAPPTGDDIQPYACFISYANKDEAFAERIGADLQQHGVRYWFAPAGIGGGKMPRDQIDRAFRIHDCLLLILSEHSLQSEWLITEIRRARTAEIKQKRRKLFPIRLVDMPMIEAWECFDADTGQDLAAEVRQYDIPDFSRWQDQDAYQQAFERLLRDLQAEDDKPEG